MSTYEAATIEGNLKVEMYRKPVEGDPPYYGARRKVNCEFSETFLNDAELEVALDAFRATVLEAARR